MMVTLMKPANSAIIVFLLPSFLPLFYSFPGVAFMNNESFLALANRRTWN